MSLFDAYLILIWLITLLIIWLIIWLIVWLIIWSNNQFQIIKIMHTLFDLFIWSLFLSLFDVYVLLLDPDNLKYLKLCNNYLCSVIWDHWRLFQKKLNYFVIILWLFCIFLNYLNHCLMILSNYFRFDYSNYLMIISIQLF